MPVEVEVQKKEAINAILEIFSLESDLKPTLLEFAIIILLVFSWNKKLPLVKTPLESTWLRHEIGRCHLEMGNYKEARDYGEQSLEAAEEAEDEVWQLNASVLIAQADGKSE